MSSVSVMLPAFQVGAEEGWVPVQYGFEAGRFVVPLQSLDEPARESWRLADSGEELMGWATARGGDHTLIGASFDQGEIGELTHDAYRQMLDVLRAAGTRNLIRVWNYVRDINRIEDGLERYRRFSVGRFDALAAAGYQLGSDLPAASAVGSHRGPQLTIIALASTRAGTQIENPRQMSAWAYPAEYGPRSPSFSRATIERAGSEARLWISGTASIVGHESLHPGDPQAQMRETLSNIEAVIAAAAMEGGLSRVRMIKAYVRRPVDLSLFRAMLSAAAPGVPVIWLEADICRAELLLEIEALAV